METCEVIYDLKDTGYEGWGWPGLGLIFLLTILLSVLFRRVGLSWLVAAPSTRFLKFGAVFIVFWTVIAFAASYREYSRALAAYDQGKFLHAWGVVEDMTEPPPRPNPARITFTVSHVPFAYTRYIGHAGYGAWSEVDGALQNGQQVRIRYVGEVILQLQVCGA